MLRQVLSSVLPALLVVALTSCGYDYDSEKTLVMEGELFKNDQYRLDKVTKSSITISGADGKFRQGWELVAIGQRGEMKSHSLGNNQHLRILRVEPEKRSAELEWSWLDSVGFLTMPPF